MKSFLIFGFLACVLLTNACSTPSSMAATPTLQPTRLAEQIHSSPSPTQESYIFSFIFSKDVHIAAINFFDLDQIKKFDADLNDLNKKAINALCNKVIGSGYDWKTDLVSGLKYNILDGHRGIDFYVPNETIIKAPHQGLMRTDSHILWIQNNNLQSVIDHIDPDLSLNNTLVIEGQPVARVSSDATKGAFDGQNGLKYYEFHYGLMIKDLGMSQGWRSVDPLFGRCSTSLSNPWGHSIFREDDMPVDFKNLINSLSSIK